MIDFILIRIIIYLWLELFTWKSVAIELMFFAKKEHNWDISSEELKKLY